MPQALQVQHQPKKNRHKLHNACCRQFDVMAVLEGSKQYFHGRRLHAVLTIGAPGVPQLVGATCGIQLAPPVSFFSLCGSLKENGTQEPY